MMPKAKITSDIFLIMLLFLIIITPYLAIIGLPGDLIIGNTIGDVSSFLVPMRSFEIDLISKGTLPLWNPYVFCGLPRLADSQLFYPFSLIHLLLNLASSLNILLVLHQILSGIFMYLYLKRLTSDRFSSFIGALTFALSSLFMPRIFAGNVNYIFAMPWIPLLFLIVDRAFSEKNRIFVIFGGLVLAVQILGGHIQFVFMTLIGLFLYTVYTSFNNYKIHRSINEAFRLICILGAIVLFGIGISAVQIFPSAELARGALRFEDPVFNYSFSVPPENILTLFSPGFFGWIKNGSYWGKWYPWEVSNYAGILPLLLSFMAVLREEKYSRFFAGLFLVSLALALGAYLPGYKYLFKYLIGLNMFRAHGRFFTLGVFSLSALASLGCKSLCRGSDEEKNKGIISVAVFALALIFIFIGFKLLLFLAPQLAKKALQFIVSYDSLSIKSGFNFGYLSNFISLRKIIDYSLNYSVVFFSLGILVFLLYARRLLNENIRKILIVSLIVIDLGGFEMRYLSTFPVKNCFLNKKAAEFLKNNAGLNRCLILGGSYNSNNAGIKDKISNIGGYSVSLPRRYSEFINFSQGRPLNYPFLLDGINKPSRFFQLLGLKYILTSKYSKTDFSNYRTAYNQDDMVIYEADVFLPKAFVAHKAKFVQGRENIFKALADASFDFKDTVILEEPSAAHLAQTEGSAAGRGPEPLVVDYSPNRVVIKADLSSPGYLVLCDNYYPGWHAYIDGRETNILRADYILRAVAVAPGSHLIEFIYSPLSLKFGLFVTLLFLGIAAGFCIYQVMYSRLKKLSA